jgi:hypothetical protein
VIRKTGDDDTNSTLGLDNLHRYSYDDDYGWSGLWQRNGVS